MGLLGAFADPQFRDDISSRFASFPKDLQNKLALLQNIPQQADDIAEKTFPESARDSSVKNAFRHSLGTGLLAQEMGANSDSLFMRLLALQLAKGAGYAWEALGTPQYVKSEAYRTDTKHDLNANAVGANMATMSPDQAALISALKRMAIEAPLSQPPGLFQSSPGYLTRTER